MEEDEREQWHLMTSQLENRSKGLGLSLCLGFLSVGQSIVGILFALKTHSPPLLPCTVAL